jgi:predicted NUDIX family NTP pyrophosphohydrolase
MFRRTADALEVLLAHPGGPFWQTRDEGAWTIPKGGMNPGEDPLAAAIREFKEETGFDACPPYLALGSIVQRAGKVVHAWAFAGSCDPDALVSTETSTEWPPRSGRFIRIPEIDRARFFTLDAARRAINVGQLPLLDRLQELTRPSGAAGL